MLVALHEYQYFIYTKNWYFKCNCLICHLKNDFHFLANLKEPEAGFGIFWNSNKLQKKFDWFFPWYHLSNIMQTFDLPSHIFNKKFTQLLKRHSNIIQSAHLVGIFEIIKKVQVIMARYNLSRLSFLFVIPLKRISVLE